MWHSRRMILTLEIHRVTPGIYESALLSGGKPVTEPAGSHGSIREAIQQRAAEIPGDFAQFIEPRYAGVSAGTLSIAAAQKPEGAAAAADRIVAVLAALNDLAA